MKPLFVACAARTPLLACGLLAAAAGRARRVARLLDGWERRQKGGWTIDMEGKNHHIILIIYIYININIDIYILYIYIYTFATRRRLGWLVMWRICLLGLFEILTIA